MNNVIIYSLDEITFAAQQLVNLQDTVSVYTFHGDLGAGKTTLIQAILRLNGVEDTIQSPTYNYVHTYTNTLGYTFYHFDLYRIESIEQFRDFGFNEYLFPPQSWAFIEWPEVIKPLLKKNICNISIKELTDSKRELSYTIL
jgi:tRNA threonylcarbamoyladenosine biosynthesis protein TsaE